MEITGRQSDDIGLVVAGIYYATHMPRIFDEADSFFWVNVSCDKIMEGRCPPPGCMRTGRRTYLVQEHEDSSDSGDELSAQAKLSSSNSSPVVGQRRQVH